MTKVTVNYKNDKIVSITTSGHAFFKKPGKDIVCAGISTLITTAVNALEVVGGLEFIIFESDAKTAYMYLELPVGLNEMEARTADIILETVLVGLKGIAEGYPKNMKLHIREVQTYND